MDNDAYNDSRDLSPPIQIAPRLCIHRILAGEEYSCDCEEMARYEIEWMEKNLDKQ